MCSSLSDDFNYAKERNRDLSEKKIEKSNYLKYIILIILALLIIIGPLWLILINSFKNSREAALLSFSFPSEWHIVDNYSAVIEKGDLLRGFLNTMLYTCVVIPLLIIIGGMASWVFARSKEVIFKVFYFILISGILIPPSVVTSIKLLNMLHIYGTRIGLILFYIGILLSLSIFFMTGFIKSIPINLEDAARIDGCNNLQLFFKVILPLLKPVISTVSILAGLSVWNDFMWAFYLLRSKSQQTLMLGLFNFMGSHQNDINWHLVFADLVLVSLPFIIFYIFGQRFIISGIMGGSIKQ